MWPSTTFPECKELCAANAEDDANMPCLGIVHVTDGNQCHLKKEWGNAEVTSNSGEWGKALRMTNECRAEIMAQTDTCLSEQNTDHGGGDLALWPDTQYDDCKKVCAANSNCVGFAHDTRDNKQNCHLKSTWNPPNPLAPNVVSLEMTSSCRAEELTNGGACLREPNTDHGGGDIGPAWWNTPIEDCEELCAEISNCVGFAHDTRSGKQNCHLKSTWNGPGYLSGVVSLKMTNPCRADVMAKEVERDGGWACHKRGFREVEGIPYENCLRLCAADDGCEGFVASNTASECWLMKSFGSATTNNDRVSLRMTEECRVSIRDAWKLALYRNAAAADVSSSIATVQSLLKPPHASDAELGKLAFRLAVTKLTHLVSKLVP
eukprot:g4671.t1